MKILFFANTDWYLYNFRLPFAKALRNLGYDVVFVSPPGKYFPKIQAENFRWISIPMNGQSLNPFGDLLTLARVWKLYKRERPELTHHFTIKSAIYGSLAARLSNINVINALPGLGANFSGKSFRTFLLKPFLMALYYFSLKNTRVIFQNPDDMNYFLRKNIVKKEYVRLVRGSGVDVKRFAPQKKIIFDGKKKVLFASRLLWSKGVGFFVEAASFLSKEIPHSSFLIAGEADPDNQDSVSPNVILNWKTKAYLSYLGHLDDLSDLLKQVDVVVLPTFYGEGVPRILIEAAACGLPIISFDVPGCREIVKHELNGFLVPVRNLEKLTDAIRTVLLDDALRIRMGEESRRIACEEFSEALVFKNTLAVYEDSLAKR